MHHGLWSLARVGILFGLLSCGNVHAQDVPTAEPESSQALDNAQSAWNRFRQAFKLTYAEIAGARLDAEKKSETLENRITIKVDGTRYVGVVETPKGDRWEGNAYGKNDRYRFELRRNSREQPWVIVGLTHGSGNDSQARWIPQTAIFPLNVNVIALDELARHSVFHVTGVEENSAGLVDVSFRISEPQVRMSDGAMIAFSGGRVSLDPSRSWLPVRREWIWGPGTGRGGLGGEATEFRTEAGVSFPTKWVVFKLSEDVSPSEPYGTVTVEKLQLGGSVPYREFTLSAFGLPEPAGSRGIPGYVWLAVIALVALAVGAVLRSRARRSAIA